jgi:uncharacterized membrane protein
MTFTTPLALLLLLAIPYFVSLGRPRSRANRWRERTSLGLRLAILLLLILSLAGTQMVRAADDLAVVFLVDASDSIRPDQAEQAEAYVRQAIDSMGPSDRAAVVVFGANALVDRPMSGLAELAPIASIPQSLHTDVAEAIRLGLALFPAGSARRMVLISDGAATLGDATEAARLAAAAGVQIDVAPLTRPPNDVEAWLTRVNAPTRVNQGEAFTIDVTVESTISMPAGLRVLAGGTVILEQAIQLRQGVNNFPIRLRAMNQEFARYLVQLTPLDDTYYQNNELAAFTEVLGPPRVLLVAADGTVDDSGNPVPDESPQLRLALEATGLLVDRVTPAELPADLAGLSNYTSVVLVNVNAKHLSPRKMELLQSYVRDLGGGLVAVGGPESFGMGGYFKTPLEETLPVEMQIKDQERFPAVSIVLVIDRSGSMAANEGGVTKIQLAAEGAARVVELLNDFDEITVIPVDTQPDNVIGPASVADREAVIGQIRQIGAGGGGIYVRTGLAAAADALARTSNQVKHIIVLADGADSEEKEGVPELIRALVAENVTISMVSIGDGPDVPWLQQMAEVGGGRFHFTDRAANLPQIFTQETTSIQRSYLIEEQFFPSLGSSGFARSHPIFRALESAGATRVPALFGYIGTSSKATAQVILETHQGDPLLAAWEYGLGRSVAWTSDATGRWANQWVRWAGFPTFWSSVVRWTISQNRESNVETAITFTGEEARLTVDARGSNGTYLNGLDVEANVVAPDNQTVNLTLQQVAPGRYEALFTPSEAGAYFIRVAGSAGDEEVVIGQTSGWVLGYSPEYQQFDANPQLLATVAEIAGGRDLGQAMVESDVNPIFDHSLPTQSATRPIWPWLTLLAVVLLPLDIAVRRLVVTRRDMEQAWVATFGRQRPERVSAPAARSERVSRLFQAKERAGTAGKAEQDIFQPPPVEPAPVQREDATSAAGAQQPPLPAKPARQPTAASRPDGSLASRLLEKKRQQGTADDPESRD